MKNVSLGDIVVSRLSNEIPYNNLITIQKIVFINANEVEALNYRGLHWTESRQQFNADFLAFANKEQLKLFNLGDSHCDDGSISDYRGQ